MFHKELHNKEMVELVRACLEDGWSIERRKKGFKLTEPLSGKFIFIHCTQSDRRAVRNARAFIYRETGRQY